MKNAFLILVVAIAAFVAGGFLGGDIMGGDQGAPAYQSTTDGAGYQRMAIDSSDASDINEPVVNEGQSGNGEQANGGLLNRETGVTNIKAVAGSADGFAELIVNAGESIQAAVAAANPKTIIRVMPGTYEETVYIDKDDIRLIGVIESGERPILDGLGRMNDAILYSGNNIVIENFTITKYKGNAIMGQAGNNFEIRNNIIIDTGVYGIFPQLGQNGVVEHNVVSGIEDAAIYVGMSDNVHVAYNEVFDSVAGIEIENSRHAIVEYNNVYNNTGGILAFITPGLPIKTTYNVIIRHNFINSNNHPNFAAPGSLVSGIAPGTGIMVMAADEVVIEGNIIKDNKNVGILSVDHGTAAEITNITLDPEVEPNTDKLRILDNLMINNGYEAVDEIRGLMLTRLQNFDPDIFHIGPSVDSCILNRHRYRTSGADNFADCGFTHTRNITTLLMPPVQPRQFAADERGKAVYLGVCTGCHSYTGRLIGPPVQVLQALYLDNPKGLADYIADPIKKREDYPEMPPQRYLDEKTRFAVAEYMLALER